MTSETREVAKALLLIAAAIALTGCLDHWLTAPKCHQTIRTYRIPVTVFTLDTARDTVTAAHETRLVTDTVCVQ
jgi:hypothetical protein